MITIQSSYFRPKDTGRVYILELYIDGRDTPVYKVGKSSGISSKSRMLEIIGSYFDKYRVTPITRIVRDRGCDNPLDIEKAIHSKLEEYAYTSTHKFSGCTELFDISKDLVIKIFEEELNNVTSKS